MRDAALANIVGNNNVLDDESALGEFTKDSNLETPLDARCMVRPANVEEVQDIVKWANETATPLIPVSSGSPHGRSDTSPSVAGAVIVDLSRMNRIVRIDEKNRIAMVEPAVTFGELQSALSQHSMSAYLPLGPRVTKSVIGSMLEREPITRPSLHWDSTDPLLCAEVVFGTGDRFRTGEASGPDTIEEQWEMGRVQMNPFGHSHVDFQRLLSGAQGTIGIVTWATLKCFPLPEMRKILFVPSSDLAPLVELAYLFTRSRFGGSLFIVNNTNFAALTGRQTDGAFATLPWVLVATFEGYGILPADRVAFQETDFRAMARSNGCEPDGQMAEQYGMGMLKFLTSPSNPYWKSAFTESYQDLFFLTTLDRVSAFTNAMSDMTNNVSWPSSRLGVYIQPIVQGTSCHCEFTFYYNGEKSSEAISAAAMVHSGSMEIDRLGGFFSRPYPAWRDVAYRHSPTTVAMQKKIKDIFDPKGVLNPGKLCF